MSDGLAWGKTLRPAPLQRVAWAGVLAATLPGSVGLAQAGGDGEPAGAAGAAFEEAIAEYERCHWSRAWELLASAADSGDPQAARFALDMHRFGPELFGRAFSVSEARLATWEASHRRPRARSSR